MIYSDGCPKCQEMREIIEDHVDRKSTNVNYYNSESNEALDVALETGISDLPGCCVDGEIIEGEYFSKMKLIDAIRNL